MMLRQWLLTACLCLLSACSPYNYGKEIADFSKDMDKVSAAYKGGYDGLRADRAALSRRVLIIDKPHLRLAASCGFSAEELKEMGETDAPCTLVRATAPARVTRHWGDILLVIRPDPDRQEADRKRRAELAKVTDAITDYARALAAVTNADDQAAYYKSVTQLSDSDQQIAAFVPNGIGAVAPAAVNLLGWMVGTALDQQRFDALKDAVTKVGTKDAHGVKPIAAVQEALSAGMRTLGLARRRVVREQVVLLAQDLGPALSTDAYIQRLDEAQALVSMLEGLRQVETGEFGKDLEKAHDALVAAVTNPKTQVSSFLAALAAFKDKATALKDALSATTDNAKK
jgi:hypothetical protein